MGRKGQIQFTLYPPSKDIIDAWEEEAKKFGLSASQYVIEMADLGQQSKAAAPRSNVLEENKDLREENQKLREDLRRATMLLEKYEADLYKLKFSGFSEIDAEEAEQYDEVLVELLRRGRTINSYEILKALEIDPKDSAAVKLIQNQLEELRRFGLVKETANGWRWVD